MPYQALRSWIVKKSTRESALFYMVSQSEAKSNSACPTLTNLKSGEFDPPEIKLLDKLEFVTQLILKFHSRYDYLTLLFLMLISVKAQAVPIPNITHCIALAQNS